MCNQELGLIHLYTGNGKGKTTAAVGLAVRAVGAGLRVLFAQFMKSCEAGELAGLQELGVAVLRRPGDGKFTFQMTAAEKEAHRERQQELWREMTAVCERFDLVVLDEICSAVSTGMIDAPVLVAWLEAKPAHLEVVLTGRDADPAVTGLASYISFIEEKKHPFRSGTAARKGIEF